MSEIKAKKLKKKNKLPQPERKVTIKLDPIKIPLNKVIVELQAAIAQINYADGEILKREIEPVTFQIRNYESGFQRKSSFYAQMFKLADENLRKTHFCSVLIGRKTKIELDDPIVTYEAARSREEVRLTQPISLFTLDRIAEPHSIPNPETDNGPPMIQLRISYCLKVTGEYAYVSSPPRDDISLSEGQILTPEEEDEEDDDINATPPPTPPPSTPTPEAFTTAKKKLQTNQDAIDKAIETLCDIADTHRQRSIFDTQQRLADLLQVFEDMSGPQKRQFVPIQKAHQPPQPLMDQQIPAHVVKTHQMTSKKRRPYFPRGFRGSIWKRGRIGFPNNNNQPGRQQFRADYN